jgi:hypothetical protein
VGLVLGKEPRGGMIRALATLRLADVAGPLAAGCLRGPVGMFTAQAPSGPAVPFLGRLPRGFCRGGVCISLGVTSYAQVRTTRVVFQEVTGVDGA